MSSAATVTTMPLYERVLHYLNAARGQWPAVSKGSGVPYHTLTKIAQKQHRNPGVNTCQRIADHFEKPKRHKRR